MMTRFRAMLVLPLFMLLASCGLFRSPTPTPLPGWRSPVSELFVDESAFPEGWKSGSPEGTIIDPTVNHVTQEWGHPGVAGTVRQSIWRGYTAADVQDKYDELRKTQFAPSRPLYPGTLYVPFDPPTEIAFQSQVADQFYLACGWWGNAYCEVIARYRNYVVELWLDREAEYEGHISHGLTYPEIEAVIRAMDAKCAWALETLPTPVP